MKISTAIERARRQWDTLGWTSNAKRTETDSVGNVTHACAQEVIDRTTPPGPLRRAVTEFLGQAQLMGIPPGEFNDLPDMTHEKVKAAFCAGRDAALEQGL